MARRTYREVRSAGSGRPSGWMDPRAACDDARHERRRLREADPRPRRARQARCRTTRSTASGKLILDESDSYGVEMALQLVDKAGGGEVTLVSMAPNKETSGLRTALAMGAAKAILVSDDALSGADALDTAKVLAAAIKRAEPDLVLAATESTDGYTGTVPEQIAELLGLPSITFAKQVEIDGGTVKVQRQTEAGYDEVDLAPARPRVGDRRCGRAPLPVVQGDHGGQVQAGRRAHARRPRPRPGRGRRGRCRPGDRRRRRRPRAARPARSSRTTARASPRSSRSSTASRSSDSALTSRLREAHEQSVALLDSDWTRTWL